MINKGAKYFSYLPLVIEGEREEGEKEVDGMSIYVVVGKGHSTILPIERRDSINKVTD